MAGCPAPRHARVLRRGRSYFAEGPQAARSAAKPRPGKNGAKRSLCAHACTYKPGRRIVSCAAQPSASRIPLPGRGLARGGFAGPRKAPPIATDRPRRKSRGGRHAPLRFATRPPHPATRVFCGAGGRTSRRGRKPRAARQGPDLAKDGAKPLHCAPGCTYKPGRRPDRAVACAAQGNRFALSFAGSGPCAGRLRRPALAAPPFANDRPRRKSRGGRHAPLRFATRPPASAKALGCMPPALLRRAGNHSRAITPEPFRRLRGGVPRTPPRASRTPPRACFAARAVVLRGGAASRAQRGKAPTWQRWREAASLRSRLHPQAGVAHVPTSRRSPGHRR